MKDGGCYGAREIKRIGGQSCFLRMRSEGADGQWEKMVT